MLCPRDRDYTKKTVVVGRRATENRRSAAEMPLGKPV